MKYKHDFLDESLIELSFLTKKSETEKLQLPEPQTEYRGFSIERKITLLQNLAPIIPQSRLIFWQQLPECQEETEDI